MEFTCERQILLEGINAAQKAVSAKSLIPALEGILIETGAGHLRLTGYDLEIGIECVVEAEIKRKGSAVFNSRIFGEIVRKLSGDTVMISVDDNYIATVKCGKSVYDISILKPSDFPELPKVEGEKSITINQKKLKSMIRQTIFAVSQNDSKPVHTGSLFEFKENILTVVSVDGYRLALRREAALGDSASFIVPGKSLSEISKILADDENSEVTLSVSRKHIQLVIGEYRVISRLLEGEFLDYRKTVPTDGQINSVIAVRDFIDCVERASLLISEKVRSPVRLNVDDTSLIVKCVTQIGKIEDEIQIESSGGTLEIGFNNRYLLDALKASEKEKILMVFSSPLSPCVIKPEQGDEFLFLVLPVKLKTAD